MNHIINGVHRAAILSDIHLPYEDKDALTKALKLTKEFSPDIIILNGDICDCISLSRYSRSLDERNFNEEVKAVRKFLYDLRRRFPLANILYRIGNHEQRVQKFLIEKAAELSELDELMLPSLFHLKQLKINWLESEDLLDLCGLKVLHGHEVSGTLQVFPARGLQLATMCSSICGHSHRSSFFIARNIERKVIQSWTCGCLANLRPKFSINNNWIHGIALVETKGRDKFTVRLENW